MSRRNQEQDNEWNEIIGYRIAVRRDDLGKTQKWLANETNVSHTTIWTVESGKVSISSHILFRIARALSCDMDYFYEPILEAESVVFENSL